MSQRPLHSRIADHKCNSPCKSGLEWSEGRIVHYTSDIVAAPPTLVSLSQQERRDQDTLQSLGLALRLRALPRMTTGASTSAPADVLNSPP